MSDSTSTLPRMTPGDDMHLTLLMTPHGLNFVTGQDRQHLLAFGRAAFEAGKVAAATQQGVQPVAFRLTNTSFRKPRYEYFSSEEAAKQRQADFNRSVDDGGLYDLTPLYTRPTTLGMDTQIPIPWISVYQRLPAWTDDHSIRVLALTAYDDFSGVQVHDIKASDFYQYDEERGMGTEVTNACTHWVYRDAVLPGVAATHPTTQEASA